MPLEPVTCAVTVHQPYAQMIARGLKRVETRSWPTRHRGLIAIHAAKQLEHAQIERVLGSPAFDGLGRARQHVLLDALTSERYPLGAIIAVANVIDVVRIGFPTDADARIPEPGTIEYALGDYQPGRYAWLLSDATPIRPVPCRGQQAIWTLDTQTRLDVASAERGTVTPHGIRWQ